MDSITNILTRRSIRAYEDRPISEEDIQTILKAGVSGPSCCNLQDWHFVVVTDREKLDAMADTNGMYAQMLKEAPLGILVCGDMNKAHKPAPDYWIIDASIAAQNMILAARDLGIGSVWLGTWPQMFRVEGQKKLFDLPENLIPHSVIAFGYSKDCENTEEKQLDLGCITYVR